MSRATIAFIIYLFLFPMAANATGFAANSPAYFADEEGPFSSADEPQEVPAEPDPRVLTTTPQEREELEQGQVEDAPAPEAEQVDQYVCSMHELEDSESAALIDLLKKGFTGNEIAGETEKDLDRPELATKELVLQNPDDENSAVKAEIPSLKFGAKEASQFLNNRFSGPFAFGVVLDDSIRTGRCETFDGNCTLTGPNLTRRNSGAGILADTKPIREVFSGLFDGNQSSTNFTNQEADALRTALDIDSAPDGEGEAGLSEAQIKVATRLESELIPNSILTSSFDAKMVTNCANPDCVITTYSLFDKYFNSWMSSEMVVSTFGPSLLYQTKKLFGWTGRRGFLSGVRDGYYEFQDQLRKKFITEESVLGRMKASRIKARIDRNGWRDWYQQMVTGHSDGSGYYLMQTEGFQNWWGKAQGKGGFLENIKTAQERAELVRLFKDMRSVLRAGKARNDDARQAFELAKETFGLDNAVTRQKYIEYGRDTVNYMDKTFDEMLGADYIEWITRHPNAGFYNKGVLQVRPDGGSEVINLFHEHRNVQRILRKFADDGTFRGFENDIGKYGSAYQSQGDDLVYYVFDRQNAENYRGLSYSNLERAATNQRDTFAATDYGEYIPYTTQSVPFIQNRIGSNPQLFQGNWTQAGALTPAQITAMITNARTGPTANMKFGVINTQTMIDTLQERNWVSRRYWNALDKLLAQEDELIRSYFTIKGGAKWTALPYGYWWAKRGFGVEGISLYQLP
ncbi:MAG: hypothetical protein NUV67_02005, partial [archaeon]|nr:hypothetical protein [archaeon]